MSLGLQETKGKFQKKLDESSLSNNEDDCHFLFGYCKDYEMSDFCFLKLDLLIWYSQL